MTATTEKKRYNRKAAIAAEPEWSQFQQDIYNWIDSGSGSLRVGAVAGSGKTTVLCAIVNRLPSTAKVSVLAFNKHTVEALRERLPSRITVATANGMGQSILTRHFYQEGAVTLEENKYRQISRKLIDGLDLSSLAIADKAAIKQAKKDLSNFLNRLIAGCQATLSEPTIESLKHLIDYYVIESPIGAALAIPLVAEALKAGELMAHQQRIVDFGDQLWLPHIWDLRPAPRDWVLLDEVQDANPAQLALYKKLLGDTGRAIAVGDEFQAIQGFAFASPAMWGKVATDLNAETLPLSVCYRCPSSHLDLARAIVSGIQPRPDAPVGELEVVAPSEIKGMAQAGDMILSRFTAPLIALCLRLIVSGIQARVRGRDIGAQLVALAEQCGSEPYSSFAGAASRYCLPKIQELRDNDDNQAADSLEDRYSAIAACHQEFGSQCATMQQFTAKIAALFTDDKAPVILSTIHRAKGDEADRVFLLGVNSLPYLEKVGQEWQEQQEWNLLYVALTRAKKSLFLVPLPRKQDRISIDELLTLPYGGLPITPVTYTTQLTSTVAPTEAIETVWMPAIGDRVHKRFQEGWNGSVALLTADERVEVLWDYDDYALTCKPADLRPYSEKYQKSFQKA